MKIFSEIIFLKFNHFYIFSQTPLFLSFEEKFKIIIKYIFNLKAKYFLSKNDMVFQNKNFEIKERKGKLKKSKKNLNNKNKPRIYKSEFRFVDFYGIEKYLSQIRHSIEYHLFNWKYFENLYFFSINGVILSGPPKSGKTFLAYTIAGELQVPIFYINSVTFKKFLFQENQKKILSIFMAAYQNSPSIILIEEIEKIFLSVEKNQKEQKQEFLQRFIDITHLINKKKKKKIILLGTTSDATAIQDTLKKPGIFTDEIKLKNPTFFERRKILENFLKNLKIEKKVTPNDLAKITKDFGSGDLFEFILTVIFFFISRISTKLYKGMFTPKIISLKKIYPIKKIDFDLSFEKFRIKNPNFSKNNSFPILWNDIGGLDKIRKIMSNYIIEPIKKFSHTNPLNQKSLGFLLYGPPGCGKTLIAQAVATESGAKFIGVKGPEIFDKFLGESERSIRSIFSKARSLAPSIIFFDEIDSIANKRSGTETNDNNGASDRVLNQLLTEMDGFESNRSVFIIAATNRPDIVDKALLRPGRIDKNLFIPLPNKRERIRILKTILKKSSILPYLDLKLFSKNISVGFSGADLMSSAREAVMNIEKIKVFYCIFKSDFKKIGFFFCLFLGSKNILKGCKKVKKNLNIKDKFH